jgi:hypothetical protein
MNKHLKRFTYGIIAITLITLLISSLGYRADFNSEYDPILSMTYPLLEFLLTYILGAGVDSLLVEYFINKEEKR